MHRPYKWWNLQILTKAGIVRTKHVRAYEDEFPSTDRLESDVCSDTENFDSADSEPMGTFVSLSSSTSSDDGADSDDDSSHNENADSDNGTLE